MSSQISDLRLNGCFRSQAFLGMGVKFRQVRPESAETLLAAGARGAGR